MAEITRPVNLQKRTSIGNRAPYTLLGLVERSLEVGKKPQRLREVRTFGEVLRPHIREVVKEHWNVPVVDNYSAMEIATIAHQCPESTNLHVMAEGVLLEVIDGDGRPCEAGDVGRVVLTALHNYATPIIRYALGDYAEVAEPCSCGRSLPALARITGRSKELMVYPNGDRRFPDPLLHTLRPDIPIQQYQLVQKTVSDVQVNLAVARPLSSAEETKICDTLTERLYHPFEYELVYMDEIPRTPGGKFEAFRSEIIEDD